MLHLILGPFSLSVARVLLTLVARGREVGKPVIAPWSVVGGSTTIEFPDRGGLAGLLAGTLLLPTIMYHLE